MARNYAGSGDRSGGQRSFARVPQANIPRSVFNRSHGHKTTFDSGYLIPICLDEVLPGDTMTMTATCFARLATPLFPIMDQIHLDTFWFFVPLRLVWDNFQKFMGEQTDPGDSTVFAMPTLDHGAAVIETGSIFDYMGLPCNVAGIEHVVLPMRAYNLVYNDWFRDENMVDSATVTKADSGDVIADFPLQRRGKRHDYFTSCLPWPQKSDAGAVTLPLGSTAPVIGDVTTDEEPDFIPTTPGTAGPLQLAAGNIGMSGGGSGNLVWDDPKLVADLTSATAATINELRQAFQIQKLYERDARGGTRYTEIIRSHFGVVSPDMRLQRPEYLGGHSVPVNVTPVASTAKTTDNLGDLAGFAVATGTGRSWTKSFTEHGYVIGLVSARADLHYHQGIPRLFSRSSRLDHYWPALAHLGEQSVLNKEIFYNNDANDELVFGYQERYAEYRYKPSVVSGLMRSTVSGGASPLDAWHLAQDFAALPALNQAFIEENPPIDRVVAAPTEPDFIFDSYFQVKHVRPMPTYSVPGLIDHF